MTGRDRVSIQRCADYDAESVHRAVSESVGALGGMGAFVTPGARVLVKPNLLMKAHPDRAVTTHPEVVRAVVRLAADAGASDIAIGDSPGGTISAAGVTAVFEASGMAAVAREEGIRIASLEDDVVRLPSPGHALHPSFEVGRAVADADVLIDVPRLKTHGFMMMTGAVKNLFGCVPGLRKAQFHVRTPDRADFADMLLDLMLACGPALSVMDAVVAMEGDGPSAGTPLPVGGILASASAPALDAVAAAIAGFGPDEVYTVAAAARRGLGPSSPDDVEVVGVPWRDLAPPRFARPVRDLTRGMPPALARWLRARLAARPVLAHAGDCTACGTCARDCPVDAITLAPLPSFDDQRCVRCYCCQELCPRHAIGLRTPLLVRALDRGRT